MFIALLDSCVLWPSTLRDFLLSLAIEQLYRPAWSGEILAEVEDNEAAKLTSRPPHLAPGDARDRATHLVSAMRTAFPDAENVGWEPLEGTFGLPDPDDEHVLAAAVLANAGAIITENWKDFPLHLVPPPIQILSAREFARDTVALSPSSALGAVRTLAVRSGRYGPKRTEDEILDILEHRYHLTEAVEMMKQARTLT
ncbi:PIN domain-containing protein [Cryobacterium tagatosivorans]|uniref:PIN domain-containing protein n=1 Tax=Cryobacterium tagatosivorans TaxID=1259199 RepID=A0A4R8UFS5_9MICO|nr:PIN domain-containing protein [Cryobacterium tagatosivorans]TFB51062.1 PIN domain-containing protein [Cryobacterium tagatosivorans]